MTVGKRFVWPLVCAAIAVCVAKDCSIRKVGVEGEDIRLSPLITGKLTSIFWKKGEDIVANTKFKLPPGKGKKRLSLDSSSGRLILKNLSKEDTGNYTAEAFINEKIEETCFDLKILVQPDINCTVNNNTIQLNCTSASQDLPLVYSWDNINNEEIVDMKDSVVHLQRNSKPFQKITCNVIASNVSANNSINLSDCILEEPDHQSSSKEHFIAIPIFLGLILFCCLFSYSLASGASGSLLALLFDYSVSGSCILCLHVSSSHLSLRLSLIFCQI